MCMYTPVTCGWCRQGIPVVSGQHRVGNDIYTGPIYRPCKALAGGLADAQFGGGQ